MTENKGFEIICEDYSLVDVPVYVISGGDKLKFDIYGSEKDAERLCTLLNENEQLKQQIAELQYSKKMLRTTNKDLELGIRRLRKSFDEFDNMRVKHIHFLQKRMKKYGISIYYDNEGGVGMTENKRFIMEESEGQDIIYDNEGLDDYYHLGNDTRDVKALCDLLNEQEERIQELEQFKLSIISFAECNENINRRTLNNLIELIDYDQ